MKSNFTRKLNIAALVIGFCASAVASQAMSAQNASPKYKADVPKSILIPDTVNTKLLGTLKFFDGMPSQATVEKAYDFLDVSREPEAFFSGVPGLPSTTSGSA